MLSHSAWPHRLSPSTNLFLTRTATTLAHAQSEESGIEPGQIATITGSFVSFGGQEVLDHDHYDTDHTDLGSEPDESEVRRGLLRDQWRQFFDKFDPEGFGEIPWTDFLNAMNRPEFRERVNTGKRQIFFDRSRTATAPAITFQDFVNVAAYKSLITKLKEIDKNANRDSVVKKINSLRTNIRKEKKKIEDSQRSGSGTDEVYTPTLWYYHLFDFLEDQVTPRSSSSNVINDPDEITEEHPNGDSQRYTAQVDIDDQSQLDHHISTNLTEKSITPKRNPPPRPPKRATPDYNSVLQTIDEHFKKPKIKEDCYDVFGKNISLNLRDITDTNQRLLAEKIINEPIFLAETGQLTVDTLSLHHRSSDILYHRRDTKTV